MIMTTIVEQHGKGYDVHITTLGPTPRDTADVVIFTETKKDAFALHEKIVSAIREHAPVKVWGGGLICSYPERS